MHEQGNADLLVQERVREGLPINVPSLEGGYMRESLEIESRHQQGEKALLLLMKVLWAMQRLPFYGYK